MPIQKTEIRGIVEQLVLNAPVVDMHTHLYPPSFASLLLWGIDDLLTYHYLVAEVMRVAPLPMDDFWGMTKQQQAELIWKRLFVERTPVSESCRGILTCLQALGIDSAARDLSFIREQFNRLQIDEYIERVFQIANVRYAVMTNDPFNKQEREYWMSGTAVHPRLKAALRIDPLLSPWETASSLLIEMGYEVGPDLNDYALREIRRFLEEWVERLHPLYMAVSLSPDFAYPDSSSRTEILDSCILPFAREHNLPFALMIGVKRQINPSLKLAGDGVGKSDLTAVENLCVKYPDNKFLVTLLSRENQHELCVIARKFPNLMPFGCWWFLNNPSLIDEITRMRLELLGLGFIPQHSDARILDQLLYKWNHSRRIIASVLADKYEDLLQTGWQLTQEDIRNDIERLFERNFEDFAGV